MMLNDAVFPPMPMARISTATIVNPGDFRNWRIAYCRFWSKVCTEISHF